MKTMSKLRMLMMIVALAITAPTFASNLNPTTEAAVNNAATNEAKSQILLKRLEEIRDMDKSDMTRAEKKALRKEVKENKASMKAYGGGVYLSVGAIIIIILLLILIF